MYQFSAERDQQQNTTLTINKGNNLVIVKTTRIHPAHHQKINNKLSIDFNILENHEYSSKWSALEHNLCLNFQDIVAAHLLPTSQLKVHLFILNSDQEIESVIFNGIWVCFLIHGVPMKRSVFQTQWQEPQNQRSSAIFDIHQPSRIISGQYNSPPPESTIQSCREYKESVMNFLKREWSR